MEERRVRRKPSSRGLVSTLYLCFAVAASGGPRVARGGDAPVSDNVPQDDDAWAASAGGTASRRHSHRHDHQSRRNGRIPPPDPLLNGNNDYGYDPLVIDPVNMFGSPHGGFSRDVPSRLSRLPLRLPSLSLEAPPENPSHLQVRDSRGRLLACRVYHQDELDPDSWDDGLFEPPHLVVPAAASPEVGQAPSGAASAVEDPGPGDSSSAATATRNENTKARTASGVTLRDRPDDDDHEGEGAEVTSSGVGTPGGQPQDSSRQVEMVEVGLDGRTAREGEANANKLKSAAAGDNVNENGEEDSEDDDEDNEVEEDEGDNSVDEADDGGGDSAAPTAFTIEDVEERLGALEGVCAHIHLGWWSTEWHVPCYKTLVRQFHVQVEQKDASQLPHQVQIVDFTSLGRFERRRIEIIPNSKRAAEETQQDEVDGKSSSKNANSNSNNLPPNPLAGNQVEIARVLDVHAAGDVCEATGEPRSTLVQLLCCTQEVMDGARQFPIPPDADPANIPPVALYGVYEDPDKLCNYVVTVCTSLLCDGLSSSASPVKNRKKKGLPTEAKAGAASSRRARTSRAPHENESIREILDRTLGDRCLDAATDGWWSYSYCHADRITQYHEVLDGKKARAGVQLPERIIEAEHLLGVYQPGAVESYPNHDEWMHVVNATADRRGRGGGTGTYFEMEYTNGDVCDHSDVTDAAIIAGGAAGGASGGVIARASTVRFFCGKTYQLAVSEDSTCHYIVEVTIPDLCTHPVFKEPIMKKQVVKCLPVNEDGLVEDDENQEEDESTTEDERQKDSK